MVETVHANCLVATQKQAMAVRAWNSYIGVWTVMDNSLTRPLAVVTGASNGIGYELAKQFAQHGFDLLVTATGASINEATQDEASGQRKQSLA